MTVVVVVVALVVAIATYLTWLASRLDRLASRVEAARAGLVSQLVTRAEAAVVLAEACGLAELGAAAAQARSAHPALLAGAPLDAHVEDVENALSRALRAPAVAATGRRAPVALHALDSASARVALARQLHNDAVRDVLALRRRRLVRMLRLSGRGLRPAYFEIDDALPVRVDDAQIDDCPVGPVGPVKTVKTVDPVDPVNPVNPVNPVETVDDGTVSR